MYPTAVESFLLVKLGEECAEVIKACAKILEHGFIATNEETGIHYDNQGDLARELGDVCAAMDVLCEMVRFDALNAGLNPLNIEELADKKRIWLRARVEKLKHSAPLRF